VENFGAGRPAQYRIAVVASSLPEGVVVTSLRPHRDERGAFTEVWRAEWETGVEPVQWNVVRSAPGVLRGVHVHSRHDDYLLIAEGRAVVGLVDLRRNSETTQVRAMLELGGEQAVTIPHGVAHGFYFPERSIHVYAVSHYFDPADELGCRYDDPDLGLDWPSRPQTSERDARLGPFTALVEEFNDPPVP